jgi:hypothetical protein
MTNVDPPPPFGICGRPQPAQAGLLGPRGAGPAAGELPLPLLDPRVMSVEMAEVCGGSGILSLGPAR